MNNWGQLGVFDLETTGVDVDTARIVSACVAILDPDGTVVSRWDWLADPGVEIPAGASAVHGITTERAQAMGRQARDVVAEITQSLKVLFALGVPLVVYNAPYDLTLLDRECRRYGIDPVSTASPVIDPLVLDKVVDKYRKGKRTLEVTAALYTVELDDAHDAGADAIAAGRVALALGAAYSQQLDVPLVELHQSQIAWYAEQAASFADYIRRVKGDQDFVADTEWPIRSTDHPTSIQDTQPIPAPSPRPSYRVPHLDFDTGVLVLDRPALEAPPVRASESVSEIQEVTFDDVEPALSDAVVSRDADAEPVFEPLSLVEPLPEESADIAEPDSAEPDSAEPDSAQPAQDYSDAAAQPELLWNDLDIDTTERESGTFSVDTQTVALEPVTADSIEADGVEADGVEADGGAPTERPALRPTVLRVAAAIINDAEGRTLLVRKRGSSTFMQAGGKIERGESAVDALSRELLEEVGLELDLGATEYLGSFRADAANEADTVIRAEVFALTTTAVLVASFEIEELLWIDTDEPAGVQLAPLTRDTILPLWVTRRATGI
jgi:DNA polymerase III epsilon subunit-like protein/8-oxo-dGTP pyrophosphatase MutT (NUDIX family)